MKQLLAEAYRAELEAEKASAKPIGPGASEEEVRAFRERVERRDGVLKRRVAIAKLDVRERRYVRLLHKYHREAGWMCFTHDFPDGRPQQEQSRWELALWSVFINALQRTEAGGGID